MRPRRGMTLVEVMIALTILATAMLALAAFMGKLAQATAIADVKNTANELAASRIEEVKTAPRYSMIDSAFPGNVALGPPYTGYSRQTIISHKGGGASDLDDYKTVTVIVRNKRLGKPVKRSTIIAAY